MLSLAVLYVVTAVLSPVPVTELVQCRPFDRHVRMCLLADRCTWHDCAEPTGCSPPKGANCVRLLGTGAARAIAPRRARGSAKAAACEM